MRFVRAGAAILLWIVILLCLAASVVPHFLDRIYYRGPVTAHFDGAHFFNPDGDDDRLRATSTGSRVRFIWRQAVRDPTRPRWPDHIAVTPARPPARVEGERMLATWIGHASMLVQTSGLNILTDPVWSMRAGPFGTGPKRVAAPGIALADLPRIDIVLISHNHYDHLDLATLKQLWERDRPLIVTSLGNDAVIANAGVQARAFDWGQRIQIKPGIWIAVTRSHHWDSRWFADRNRALWSSFVVGLPGGNFFFAGDTGYGDGKWAAEAAALGPIRLAAIPIGAFRFGEGQMTSGSHIGPRDAVRIWDGLGRPQAIPIHWGTFRLSWEGYRTPPEMLAAMLHCARVDPARFAETRIGQTVAIAPLHAAPAPDLAALAACERAGSFEALR